MKQYLSKIGNYFGKVFALAGVFSRYHPTNLGMYSRQQQDCFEVMLDNKNKTIVEKKTLEDKVEK